MLANRQFGVSPAGPVDDQVHRGGPHVDVRHDLLDERADDPLFETAIAGVVVPCHGQCVRQTKR